MFLPVMAPTIAPAPPNVNAPTAALPKPPEVTDPPFSTISYPRIESKS